MSLIPVVICAKDIMRITGRSMRYARRVIRAIREKHGKSHGQFISLKELCDHIGLHEEDVLKHLP